MFLNVLQEFIKYTHCVTPGQQGREPRLQKLIGLSVKGSQSPRDPIEHIPCADGGTGGCVLGRVGEQVSSL